MFFCYFIRLSCFIMFGLSQLEFVYVGSFYLPDSAGQRQAPEHFHREPVDCAQVFVRFCTLATARVEITSRVVSQVDPSGMYYITSAKDGSIRLWGQSSMQLQKTIHLGQTWVLAMTMLPVLGGSFCFCQLLA